VGRLGVGIVTLNEVISYGPILLHQAYIHHGVIMAINGNHFIDDSPF
jgi:hypothetical protein